MSDSSAAPTVLFLCVHNAGRSDPFGKDVEEVRPTRDEIGRRVRELLASLGVRPVAAGETT